MKVNELLGVAVKAGEILLRSGAEIYRVEDTINRICLAYGVKCESLVLVTGILVSVEGQDGETLSIVRRINGQSSIDLGRIELVNSFSRGLQHKILSYEEAQAILTSIENKPRYKFFWRLCAASAIAFIFTLLFKGNFREGAAAFFISAVIYSIKEKLSKAGFFQFFEYFISGVIAGGMSIAAVKLMPGMNIYKIIIGAIMILVPGMAMTNGIKDALYGDTVSSLCRLTEAVSVAIAVGSGVAVMFALGLKWIM